MSSGGTSFDDSPTPPGGASKGTHTDWAPSSAAHKAAMKSVPQDKGVGGVRSVLGRAKQAGGLVGTAARIYSKVATGGASAAVK